MSSKVNQTGSLVEMPKLVGVLFLRISFIIGEGSLEVVQTVQPVGFGKDTLCIIGIDGQSIFAAGDGGIVVLTHKLGAGQSIPIAFGVGVMVYQFIKDSFAVFVFP